MSLTNFGEAQALDLLYPVAAPTNKWISLFTVAPGEGTAGTEVAGGSYARVQVAWAAAVQGAPTTKNPTATVTFPQATADWAAGATQVVAFGVHDAVTGGNLIQSGALTTPRNILNLDIPNFAPANLTLTMD